ncbi:MAG: hypothetical protein GY870_01375, partial [archaeon]|nr:hypothetical protein [archaeon]
MRYRFYFILITILLSHPLYADNIRIAVMNFKAHRVSKTLSRNVSELIRVEMINTGKYTIIEKNQINKILKEQSLQYSGCTDITCAVETGKMLSANKILIGTVGKIGGILIVSIKIVDVQSKNVDFSAIHKADSENELIDAITILFKKIEAKTDSLIEKTYILSEHAKPFEYDPWYMGIEYQLGIGTCEKENVGAISIAMNFSNSYGRQFYYGCNLGFKGIETPYDVGVFAQLTFGIN